MRLAIVSDIHGNLPALEAVVANINAARPDLVINLGDCVSGPLWPKETLQLLHNGEALRLRCRTPEYFLKLARYGGKSAGDSAKTGYKATTGAMG